MSQHLKQLPPKTAMNFQISQASIRDASQIAKIHTESWQAIYHDKLPAKLLYETSLTECTIRYTKSLV